MTVNALGVGLVYVPGLEPLLETRHTSVDVIEIEPQTLWQTIRGSDTTFELPERAVRHLRELPQPKVIHSVGNGLGGSCAPSASAVSALQRTVQAFDAPWFSEHLSFTEVVTPTHRFHTGFMLPPLQTPAAAVAAARNIRSVATQLSVPLLIEPTVNYLRPRPGEMGDGEFVRRVVEVADCGLLLDLHNVWTNERNGRQSVQSFLESIPLDRVWEVHLAGGFELDGYWLDAHSGEIPAPVLEIAEDLIPVLPSLKVATFEVFPSFVPLVGLDGIQRQLELVKDLWSRRSGATRSKRMDFVARPEAAVCDLRSTESLQESSEWETALGSLVAGTDVECALAYELATDPGVQLMRKLAQRFRAGSISKSYGVLIKLLFAALGRERLEALLQTYLSSTTPEPAALDEVARFVQYIRGQDVEVAHFDDVVAYEEAQVRADMTQSTQYVVLRCHPKDVLEPLADGRLPNAVRIGRFELEVAPLRWP